MNAKGNVKKPLITLRQLPNVRSVPEAEVDVDILNVGFGDVVYQGVTESKAGYIRGMGAREAEAHTRKCPHKYIFLENASHTFMGCSLLTHKFLIYLAFVSFVSSRF